MKKHNRIYNLSITVLIFFIISCSNNDKEKLIFELLETENELLKQENDSLKYVLSSEILSPVVFANKYNGYETNNKDIEFVVALAYLRDGLINDIAFDVFSNEDSLDAALYENQELLSQKINKDSFDGVFVFNATDYSEGDNFFGGVFSINSTIRKEIPFKFKFNYKKIR